MFERVGWSGMLLKASQMVRGFEEDTRLRRPLASSGCYGMKNPLWLVEGRK